MSFFQHPNGIHTCSKGCKKPGCNPTLGDTIEEQNQQIEALKRDVLQKTADNARLKAEVEELKLENSQYEEHHKYGQDVIISLRGEVERLTNAIESSNYYFLWIKLKAEVERLTKESDIFQKCCEHQKNRIERLRQNERLIDAGNALHHAAEIAAKWGVTATQMGMPRALYAACRNWNAAKEGKQS